MKKPEKIKKGLRHCSKDDCKGCNYEDDCNMADGFSVLAFDALAYIQQLEQHIADLDKMVAQLEAAHRTEYCEEADYDCVALGEARKRIAELEAAQPKWISVEERLPENEKPVLIATKWSMMGMRGMVVSCGFHTDGKTFICDSDYEWTDGNVDLIYDEDEDEYIVPECWWESVRYSDEFSAVDKPVLYWMPLPEPPKEG